MDNTNPFTQFAPQAAPASVASQPMGENDPNPFAQFAPQPTPTPITSDVDFNNKQNKWAQAFTDTAKDEFAPVIGVGNALANTGMGIAQGVSQLANKAGLSNNADQQISSLKSRGDNTLDALYKGDTLGKVGEVGGELGANAATFVGLGGGSEAGYGANALAGTAQGAAHVEPDLTSRAKDAGIEGALGIAGKGAADFLGTPKIPETKQSAAAIAKDFDIPLYREQVSESPFIRGTASVQKDIPLSGATGKTIDQTKAFNKALLGTIGEDGDAVTPEKMESAYNRLSGVYDEMGQKYPLQVTSELQNHISDLANKASTIGDDAKEKAVSDKLTDFLQRIKPNETATQNVTDAEMGKNPPGQIGGDELQKWRSSVGRLMRTPSSQSPELGELQNLVDHAHMSQMTPEDASKMAETRQQYRNMLALERVVKTSAQNDPISPGKLQGAVKQMFGDYAYNGQSDMERLSRLGNAMQDTFPSSGTAQRKINYKLLGGLGAAAAGATGVGYEKGGNEGAMKAGAGALGAMALSRYGITPYLYQNILKPSTANALAPVVGPAINSTLDQQTKQGLGAQ